MGLAPQIQISAYKLLWCHFRLVLQSLGNTRGNGDCVLKDGVHRSMRRCKGDVNSLILGEFLLEKTQWGGALSQLLLGSNGISKSKNLCLTFLSPCSAGLQHYNFLWVCFHLQIHELFHLCNLPVLF